MERGDIVAWRCRFLREIIKKSPKDVVWLDETWVNAGHCKERAWTDDSLQGTMKTPVGKGKRLILLHAGTEEGFIPNAMLLFTSKKSEDYHEEMTAAVFKNWFEKCLLPNIRKNSIIVMDNASYHSTKLNKAPTTCSRKNDVIEWLNKNNIQGFSEEMSKPELLEIVKIHKERLCKYEVDEIAEKHGHTVIRLPPYHCHFNAIELVWADIKGYVAKHNTTFNISSVEILLREALEHFSPEKWEKVVRHTWTVLRDAWEKEGLREENVQQLLITLGQDSSDSDEENTIADTSSDEDEDFGIRPLQ